MHFPSKHNVGIIFAFDRAPNTPEKIKLAQRYLTDEISRYDFIFLAKKYLLENGIIEEGEITN